MTSFKLISLFVRLSAFHWAARLSGRDGQPLQAFEPAEARESNYEQILQMLNDTLQGNALRVLDSSSEERRSF